MIELRLLQGHIVNALRMQAHSDKHDTTQLKGIQLCSVFGMYVMKRAVHLVFKAVNMRTRIPWFA